MTILTKGDTVSYTGANGGFREAQGVVVLGGATGGASTSAGSDRSGTITTGGVAQELAPANASRKYLKGQNLSVGDLWVREISVTGVDAAASQPSNRIPAGGTFGVNTNQRVSIFGATAGQAFQATEG